MQAATGIKSPYYNKTLLLPYMPDHEYDLGDFVIFEDDEKQEEFGEIVFVNKRIDDPGSINLGMAILRKATANDIQKHETNESRSQDAKMFCIDKIREHRLDMHLIRAVFSFNGLKLKFIFTAEERVDFRELVKDLAKHFKKQIHLQQIGPRDRAKHIVAYGKCGQKTCCNRYLNNFQSITMDMVRSQNLESRGSEKLSGLCGKLLCCLRYEVESYEKAKKSLPPIGSRVKTAEYEGRVISQDILNKTLKLRVDENTITIPIENIETILSES